MSSPKSPPSDSDNGDNLSSPLDEPEHYDTERLAVKTTYASELLGKIIKLSKQVQKLDRQLNRYIKQATFALTWKRGNGAAKMAGSALKTVGALGGVVALIRPLDPRFALIMTVADRLWKIGSSIKVLNAVCNIIKSIWQKGCRKTLLEFTRCVTVLSRDLGTYRVVIEDIRKTAGVRRASSDTGNDESIEMEDLGDRKYVQRDDSSDNEMTETGQRAPGNQDSHNAPPTENSLLSFININTAQAFLGAISEFIPAQHLGLATHVVNMVFNDNRYSPVLDLMALSVDVENQSNVAQVVRELSSFGFSDFQRECDCKTLVGIGSFLHISKEVWDFLDGLQSLTERDSAFLQDCLSSLVRESASIIRAVSVLVNLHNLKSAPQGSSSTFMFPPVG